MLTVGFTKEGVVNFIVVDHQVGLLSCVFPNKHELVNINIIVELEAVLKVVNILLFQVDSDNALVNFLEVGLYKVIGGGVTQQSHE